MLQKYWFYLVTLFSVVALASALIAEYYFDLQPCAMCLKQREPYYIIIAGFILVMILKWQDKIWFYVGVQIVSIYGLFYSLWHVGIENKILAGPSSCSGGLNISTNTSSLKEQIISKAVINCEEVAWSIFGLSAATMNSLLLFLIFIINAIYIANTHGSKKEKNS
jgi:disulfide bond formation protein DsbB